ncbi:MAG TPA: FtsX-like permease family protein [Candidatus Saccharimonadales bacterium]|nr:FtsX-like permease family protein [Candidatus Saccharimonadales bacterium]
MIGVSLRSLLSHKLRLALTTIAVVLGVSFVAGTFILTDTINSTFTSIFATANAGVAVTVHGHPIAGDSGGVGGGQNHPIPTSLLATVRVIPGVKDAVGNIFRVGATLIGHDGKPIGGNGPPSFGANWIADKDISPYHLRSGTAPRGAADVVVDAGTAAKHGLVVGASLPIVFLGGVEEHFTITGIAGYGSSDNLAGATIALFTEATAERVLEGQNKYDSILVSAQSGVTDVVLRERIAMALPGYAEAETGQQAAAAAEQSTESTISTFIGTPLLVFAFISLFVGSFLIINTFNILVAQRTRELALLRALGATRAQVMASVLVEATVTGFVASLLGFAVGILIARALLSLFGSAATGGVTLLPRTVIVAVLVGTVVTVIAATLPARRATRIAPVAALAESLPETQELPRRRIAVGLAVFLLGCTALLAGLFTSSSVTLQLIGAGFLGVFLGVALLAPLLVVPVATVLGWPVRRLRGAAGLLAGENARRNPRRTALTAAALMIGLALVTCVAVLTDSVRVSTNNAIEGTLRADFIVFTQGPDFNTQAATALAQDPRLTDVTEVRVTSVLIRGSSQDISAIDPANLGSVLTLSMVSGDASAIGTTNTAIVDSTEANASNVHMGQLVTCNFPQGATVRIRIGGIYTANALVSGYIVSLATMQPNVPAARDAIVLANTAGGASPGQGESALHQDVSAFPLLMAMSRSEYRTFVGASLDSFLNLITTLLAFAIIIAVLGIANTLALSVLERTREIGVLRALGMTRSQTRSMVRWESVIISLLGAVLGLAVGLGLGVVVAGSLHDLGVTVVAVPGGNLMLYAVAAGIFGVLAAIIPTIRAARIDILRAIATE